MRLLVPGFSIDDNNDRLTDLVEYYRLPLVTFRSLVTAAIRKRTPLGERARACLEAGKIISNQLSLQLLEERLTGPDMQYGWVLSGFPRNINQAATLNAMLLEIYQPYDIVIHLKSINSRQKFAPVGKQLVCPSCLPDDAVLKTPVGIFYNRLNQLVTISSNMPLATVDSLIRSHCTGFEGS